MDLSTLRHGLQLDPLPPRQKERDRSVPHAPVRTPNLTGKQEKQALRNALRYFPNEVHATLAPEFAEELRKYGHIYMYRFIPSFTLRAYPINDYPCKTRKAAAMMHMIMNNLDPEVAQFPQELVTYGGNGQVFGNWAQFWITMKYLSEMTDEQTLVMCSGHPQGLFPSSQQSPRAVITNGMVIPNYSSRDDYDKLFALGCTMYGQMTAGSYCYIGPQGIVHGTTLTILNAGRKYLSVEDLSGKVFVTSGLGGMSGAQAKACVIAGCIGVIAEVDIIALKKRHEQGWLVKWTDQLDQLMELIRTHKKLKGPVSIGYLGNVVDVWERLVEEFEKSGELVVDLGSDQTSCHNPFGGGYYPAGLTLVESQELMSTDQDKFKENVQISLRRHVKAINRLSDAGMFFWDYGNAFLLEARRAGADVIKKGATPSESDETEFKYPSYVQHIMGDIFSLGFGPFRWVCTSGDDKDLELTDMLATQAIEKLMIEGPAEEVLQQYKDNRKWINDAGKHKMVVGSKARILYSDHRGRVAIATAFNTAVRDGRISAEVVISRDHHDVSGTDSPFRETSNIYDGSAFCADMSVQNCIGDSFRGATWVALHNGGGVGWGEVMNGGFGLVLDGTVESQRNAEVMLNWDVNNGVARRSWSGNKNAYDTIKRAMNRQENLKVTMPNKVTNEDILDMALKR